MKYEKAALTFEEQATQLINRGLIADHRQLIERLQATNYYRFTRGIMLLIIRQWLERVNSSHSWHTRVESLFDDFPEIDIVALGLDPAWREHPVWNPGS